jgi:peptidoglycan-associated lipoprotein
MQQGPSQISSGNIAPTVVGPHKDTKEVMILAALVLFLGGALAAAWYYGQAGDQVNIPSATEKVENTDVSEIIKKAGAMSQAQASTTHSTPATVSAVSTPDIIHADVYFERGRKGLTDEGKTQLSAQVNLLKQHEEYGVLIQGYTDQQGSASYNKQLGLRRAETVKTELLNAGITEHRMKAVSLGEEGVLCIDHSDVCHTMNRRVHLEIRRIGQEHMVAPAVAPTSSDPSETHTDASPRVEEAGFTTEHPVLLNPEPTPGS